MGSNQKFDALQVLRALAAGLVVYQHALTNWLQKGLPSGPEPFLPHMGEFGVKLFFCISGFIMVHTASKLPQGWDSVKKFWARRIDRIVPLYWIMTTVYLAKNVLTGQGYTLEEVVKSYGFIPFVNREGNVQPILGLGWSLNYEMFFYFVFGALLLLPRRWHAITVGGFMVALAAARALGWLGDGSAPHALYHWADSIILYFVAGVVASVVAMRWRSLAWPALSQNGAALTASLIVVLFAFFAIPANETLALAWMPVASIVPVLLCVTAQPVPCSAAWQPLVVAGDASYSTYLTHGFFMGPLARVFQQLGWDIGYHGFALLMLVACTFGGFLIFKWLEQPLHKRKWLGQDGLLPAWMQPALAKRAR